MQKRVLFSGRLAPLGASLSEGMTIRIEPFHTPGDHWHDRMLLRPPRALATCRARDIGQGEKA